MNERIEYEICGNYIRTTLNKGGFIIAEFALTSPTWRTDIQIALNALNGQVCE